MIGIDTNVLVRFLVADDERQFEKARRLLRHEAAAGDPVLISQLVLLECEVVVGLFVGVGGGQAAQADLETSRLGASRTGGGYGGSGRRLGGHGTGGA